ncbi:Retrotransposon protein putative Ty1-copia subclass [Melia azedarach]|uniref:Retrotransposon protein putative Ty1-copia subclass n=2 Tax=Melia azedarach TaxID=155640 RepID=A0ACC1XRE5_MELAZ|nr:Retrotransposon protein putative Ty1-copia subclass [Melia azedarach]KAJ4713810.1 Retrotransposon protein putative Ty1-copia subclass [Melia azedarach]
MEINSSSTNSAMSIAVSSSSKLSSKRLLFDRRYGWVFDEWKDPSEEALAGGRGMFCILPLTKAFLKTASQSINLAATSAAKVYERAYLFSPQLLQGSFNDQLHKLTSILQKPDLNCFTLKGNSPSDSTSCTSHLHIGNQERQPT